MPEDAQVEWTCEHGVVGGEGCEEYGCVQIPCAQDDHDRVWQMGREAGYRDALIALAERGGKFFDELDRNIADALRSDQEYLAAHDAAVQAACLRAASQALDDLQTPQNEHYAFRDAALWLHDRAERIAAGSGGS